MPMRGKYLKNSRWLVRECELEKKNCVFFLALLQYILSYRVVLPQGSIICCGGTHLNGDMDLSKVHIKQENSFLTISKKKTNTDEIKTFCCNAFLLDFLFFTECICEFHAPIKSSHYSLHPQFRSVNIHISRYTSSRSFQ